MRETFDLESLSMEGRIIFIAMTQAAIIGNDHGSSKKDFIELASSIWDTLELNGVDKLRAVIGEAMNSDLDKLFEIYDKRG